MQPAMSCEANNKPRQDAILQEIIMLNPRNAVYVFIATCSLAIAACKPAEGPAERAGKNIDKTAKKVGEQVDKTADKAKEALNDAKK